MTEQPRLWMRDAACRDMDPALFFDSASTEARDVCADCPVRQPCTEYALAINARCGVWGGHTQSQLNALRRARKDAAA